MLKRFAGTSAGQVRQAPNCLLGHAAQRAQLQAPRPPGQHHPPRLPAAAACSCIARPPQRLAHWRHTWPSQHQGRTSWARSPPAWVRCPPACCARTGRRQRLHYSSARAVPSPRPGCVADALLYGVLAYLKAAPVVHPELREKIAGSPALTAYVDRISSRHFATTVPSAADSDINWSQHQAANGG